MQCNSSLNFSAKFPREKSESTICIQEVLCQNCPSVCLPVHVRGCEMLHLLAWCPRYMQSVLTRYEKSVLWSINRVPVDQCRMTVSQVQAFNVLRWCFLSSLLTSCCFSVNCRFKFLFPQAQDHFFSLSPKLNYVRKTFVKRSHEIFSFGLG